jgi:hypothetical protein
MKINIFLFYLLFFSFFLPAGMVSGQEFSTRLTRIQCPDGMETYICKALYFDISPSLIEMAKANTKVVKRKEYRQIENAVNPNYAVYGHHPFLLSEDPVWQKQNGTYFPLISGPIQNFEGTGNLDGVMPPDTQGDVSLNNYVQVINSRFAVWTKTGSVVLAGTPLSTIWTGIPAPWAGRNDGDPVVLWDQDAQRWIISQFALPSRNYAELVAISQTPDPTGSWYRYVFQFSNQMPDYPKLGVWPDAYYLSFNQFTGGATPNGTGACALQRDKMLTGDPTAAMVYKSQGTGGSNPWALLPSDWDGTVTPPSGEPNYFMYFDNWSSATQQYLKIWSFHVDWTTPSNSTFAQTFQLTTAAFNSTLCSDDITGRGRCIPEPGGTGNSYKLEDLADRLMFRNQYRSFGSYQTMVTCHTVNASGGQAGCRWYELRNYGSGWSIYQQGTYAPDAVNRWMPSVAMNGNGDIALGFSLSDATSTYPSIHYTGRRSTDPLGQMTIAEQTIINGTGSQNNATYGRWGDYSMMSVDPTDDLSFWYTDEYVQTTGGWTWQTRIASFKFNNQPLVTTTSATNITSAGATLNGTINPNGLASTYYFEWGTSTAYGNNTTSTSAGSGTSAIPVSAPITGLTGGTTYHFRLDGVNSDGTSNGNDITFTTLCPVYTLPFNEPFTYTSIPSCWSQVDHQGNGEIWQFGTITAYGSYNPVLSGNYAYLNSNWYGSANSQNADLVTPTMDLSLFTSVYLKFNHYFRFRTGSSATLSYSTDNGSTWTQIQQWTSSTANPAAFNKVITGAAGYSQVKFRWNYTGAYGYYWAIDDVMVSSSGLWIGGAASNPTDWNTAGNWDGLTIPTGTTDACIPLRTYLPIINTAGNSCNNLIFDNGGQLTINPGKDLTVNGNATLNGSNISILSDNTNNAGILRLKNNLSNASSSTNPMGAGTVELSGTTSQTISGQNIIQNLTVNNAAGVTMGGNSTVNGILTLSSGNVTLGNNILQLGPSASISGTPSASAMIIATGSGELRREFPSGFTGSFTYPVGDSTGTAEYSPLTLNFTGGTFAPGNHAGVTLVNAKYPDPNITGNYLNRYWNLTQSGITGYTCNTTFQYLPSDVTGTENVLSCTMVNPLPWITYSLTNAVTHQLTADGVTSFGSFSGVKSSTPPANQQLANIDIPVGETTCYDATQVLTVAGNGSTFLVENGGNVTLVAGSAIELLDGTTVNSGGYLHGYITPDNTYCGAVFNPFFGIQDSIGFETAGKDHVIKIYPNPTTGDFIIELAGADNTTTASLTIYNMQGGKLLQRTMNGRSRVLVSLSDQPVGIYLVHVQWGGRYEVVKVIKD